MSGKTYRAKRSLTIDLEYDTAFPIAEGATYTRRDPGQPSRRPPVAEELGVPTGDGPLVLHFTSMNPMARQSLQPIASINYRTPG